MKGNLKEGTGKIIIKAEVGDLCLIKTSDYTKRGIYGVIRDSNDKIRRNKEGNQPAMPLAGSHLMGMT